jgi:phosphoribosylanthranilate isomerase
MLIKICGFTNRDDCLWAVNLGADIIGFVFAPESKRKITPAKARGISETIPSFVKKAGVFVDEETKNVRKTAELCGLKILQFHGNETPEYCAEFQEDYEVFKSIRVRDEQSLSVIGDYDVDYILLDTFREDIAGGTGQMFSWDLAVKAKEFGKKIILAGGLTADNVAEAVKKTQPEGVDVASGVERIPGRKDYDKMRMFIQNARKASA